MRYDQRYSIEFKSNEFINQCIIENSCFFIFSYNHFIIIKIKYDLILSYWKTIFIYLFTSNISMNENRLSENIFIYISFIIKLFINMMRLNLLLMKYI